LWSSLALRYLFYGREPRASSRSVSAGFLIG
jgi:hypothetical protein